MQILHGTRTAGPISVKLPDWRGFGAVERFSTLVPFSFNRRPTNVVREQFWGRAARAFLTRKSRNARFIFAPFLIPLSPVKRYPLNESKKRMTHALLLSDILPASRAVRFLANEPKQ